MRLPSAVCACRDGVIALSAEMPKPRAKPKGWGALAYAGAGFGMVLVLASLFYANRSMKPPIPPPLPYVPHKAGRQGLHGDIRTWDKGQDMPGATQIHGGPRLAASARCEPDAMIDWLRERGATVHPSLTISSSTISGSSVRGVFASSTIAPGEMLFSVPDGLRCAVSRL
eukprot:COSAG06_NODE_10280_length_1712_cov_1.404836_1_plen_170_part_00